MDNENIHTLEYRSPLGDITIASKNNNIIGLWFKGQKHYMENINLDKIIEKEDRELKKVKSFLDKYFIGENPSISFNLKPSGTEFQKQVWDILTRIPYGETVTYKDIADEIVKLRNVNKMSAQAVGGAVGRNPISILIPCHRVIGVNGKLTGYAGGIDKKVRLLELEGVL